MAFVRQKLAYVVYELTTACNLHCIHCGTTCGKVRPNELSTAEAKNLIGQIAEMGAVFIAFTGGEPLVRKDWYEIIKYAKEKDLDFSILTNGIAVTDDDIDKIASLSPVAVNISIDGVGEAHNIMRANPEAFTKSVNTLKRMQGKLPRCTVTTITKDNIHELPAIFELMQELDIRTWQIQIGTPMGRMDRSKTLTIKQIKEVADFIVESRKKDTNIEVVTADSIGYHYPGLRGDEPWQGCLAGKILCSVYSNGWVTGCLSMPEEVKEANIRDKSLREIWENNAGFSYNRKFDVKKLTGKCTNCDLNELCRAGCWSVRCAMNSPTEYPFCLIG